MKELSKVIRIINRGDKIPDPRKAGAPEGAVTMKDIDRIQAEYLVNAYSDLILRLSYTYLKSTHDAEDICQTVFLKYLTCEQKFESQEHEKAWIVRTTINFCKDILKSAWRTRTCDLTVCADVPAPATQQDDILEMVQRLPEKYRVPIYLHYYEGYKTYEIAQILGERPATVNTRMNRARNRLKNMLGGNYFEQTI